MELNIRKYAPLQAAGAVVALMFCGCTDDSYNIEDIDATAQVTINDLTLPLNLAPVEFDDLVDLSDEECVEIINGDYVLIKNGQFSSDEINVSSINAKTQDDFTPTSERLPIFGGNAVAITPTHYDFHYQYEGVDEYIISLTGGTVNFDMVTEITTTDDSGRPVNCTYSDMTFALPAGLYGTCVETGKEIKPGDSPIVSFPGNTECSDGVFRFTYHVTSFDCSTSGASLNTSTREFNYNGRISLTAGKVKANSGSGSYGNVSVNFHLGELKVEKFDGRVKYQLEGVNVDPITLDNLPDVLTQDETQITLNNPQIYLTMSNPLYTYGVEGESDLKISQERNSGAVQEADLVSKINLQAVSGNQVFCLSPVKPDAYYTPFDNASWLKMNNLGKILYGNGLPEALNIDFGNPCMKEKDVTGFVLGQNLGKVEGDYTFYAPLEFKDNSRIIYTDTQTGWGLGDDDNSLTISQFAIKAHCTSELPLDVELRAEPIDNNGNIIPGVVITPVAVEAGGSKDIAFEMTQGEITNLDGIRYTVRLASDEDIAALQPTMHLTLTNLKVIISGKYLIKDDGDNGDDDDDDEDEDED